MSSPSLIFATPAYGPDCIGGLAASARRIVGHLAKSYPIKVVTVSEMAPPLSCSEREIDGITLIEVGKSSDKALLLQGLADAIEAAGRPMQNPVFMGFYCSALAYATAIAASRRGCRPLLFARGNDIDLEIFGEAAFHIHYSLSRAGKVFCVTSEMEAKIRAFCGEADTYYVPNGLDVAEYPYQQDYRPRPKPMVGLFGDIKQKKGLDLLLEALDFNRFSLKIVGNLRDEAGKLLHGFLSLHPEAPISHADYAHGRGALIELYRDTDIVCVPSFHEGMSNVMLEAMALGKICVCSAVGGANDVIQDGENGFLFEPRSAASLAHALMRAGQCLKGDPEPLRKQAAATIRDHFNAEQEAENYRQALRAIFS